MIVAMPDYARRSSTFRISCCCRKAGSRRSQRIKPAFTHQLSRIVGPSAPAHKFARLTTLVTARAVALHAREFIDRGKARKFG
jgi:hypothetical protein